MQRHAGCYASELVLHVARSSHSSSSTCRGWARAACGPRLAAVAQRRTRKRDEAQTRVSALAAGFPLRLIGCSDVVGPTHAADPISGRFRACMVCPLAVACPLPLQRRACRLLWVPAIGCRRACHRKPVSLLVTRTRRLTPLATQLVNGCRDKHSTVPARAPCHWRNSAHVLPEHLYIAGQSSPFVTARKLV